MKYAEFKNKIKEFPVFTTAMLRMLAGNTGNIGALKVQLSHWKKKGLVVPLRKGLYLLNREDRKTEPSLFYLANQIFIPSYVSLESALAYYGLIPEFVGASTSVTARKTCAFRNEFGIFTYQHVKTAAYTGFVSVRESGKPSFLAATPEKAVVDLIYLNLEKCRPQDRHIFVKSYRFQNGESLHSKKLVMYAKKFGTRKLLEVVQMFIEEVVR